MNRAWSDEEIAIVREAWLGDGNFKNCLRFLDNRTYAAAQTYAVKRLKLGPRQHSDRGVPPYAWEAIAAELKKSPGTAAELVARTGLSVCAVYDQLRESKPGKRGKTHVVEWRRRATGGSPIATYAIGPGENAAKPSAYTNAEKIKATRARRRSNRTCTRVKSVNPFAAALGLVKPPETGKGQVYIHLTDSDGDEYQEAA